MKKLIVFMLGIVLLSIIGCSTKDNDGFYIKGSKAGKHYKTNTQWSDTGINFYTRSQLDSLDFKQDGYNQIGYNKNGFDKFGYDKDGYDSGGYAKDGYNKVGYNRGNFNKNGIHKKTNTRFNENGYNSDGKQTAFEKKHFVDNFGDPTGSKYIVQIIDGKFSNSATDNSSAYIHLISTGANDELRFDIYEYNRGSKAHYSSYEKYLYRFKDDLGNELNGKMSMSRYLKGSLNIYSDEAVEMMKKAKQIKVYIYEVDDDRPWIREDTSYNFTIDCAGFIDGIQYLSN